MNDHALMSHALQLAQRGLYTTQPNPRVGCVLVKAGEIIGEGWHEKAGEAHAEIHALRQAGDKAIGATAYVTLEPCSHHGRTPPCVDALIAAGVARVVVAMEDPNPLVSGKGLKQLAQAGIKIESGLLEAQARELNPGFIKRMTRGLPWVRIKLAMSVDGRTAMASGGVISGSGLAMAKMIGWGAIDLTMSCVIAPATERPRNMSAPTTASASVRLSVSMAWADLN